MNFRVTPTLLSAQVTDQSVRVTLGTTDTSVRVTNEDISCDQ